MIYDDLRIISGVVMWHEIAMRPENNLYEKDNDATDCGNVYMLLLKCAK